MFVQYSMNMDIVYLQSSPNMKYELKCSFARQVPRKCIGGFSIKLLNLSFIHISVYETICVIFLVGYDVVVSFGN